MATVVVDLAHFLVDGRLAPGRPGRAGEFYAHIVAAATAQPPGEVLRTPLPCRRRPRHVPCTGRLLARLRADGVIEWRCPVCGEEGLIHGWQGTAWDLRALAARAPARGAAGVVLDEDVYRVLVDRRTGLPPRALAVARRATFARGRVVLRAAAPELALLRAHAEGAAAAERRPARRRLLAALCAALAREGADGADAVPSGSAGSDGAQAAPAPPGARPGAGLRLVVRNAGRGRGRAWRARRPARPGAAGLAPGLRAEAYALAANLPLYTWAEVDLERIRHNVATLRARLGSATRLLAVVKAEGYGHGAAAVARAALEAGAELLGVARLDEALQLRAAGIAAPILVLGWTPRERAPEVVAAGLHQTVFDAQDAAALARAGRAAGRSALLHAKVDTGMGRLGWTCRAPEDAARAAEAVAALARLPGATLVGAFTHFADADLRDLGSARRQLAVFQAFLAALEAAGVRLGYRHAANTAALLRLPEAHLDLCRAGIGLYGYLPSLAVPDPGLRPALSWYARVAQVRLLRPGEAVSYGGTYVARAPEPVATVAVGYADGLPRALSNRGCLLVAGRRAPLRGRVCMDQVIVSIAGCGAVRQGDVAVVLGEGRSAGEVAEEAGTIAYEVLCGISARVPRIYLHA